MATKGSNRGGKQPSQKEGQRDRNCNTTLTPTPPSAMLGFVCKLVLNSTLTDEQRLLELRLELLYRKVRVLCGSLKGNEFPTEEAFVYFDTLEENFCKELRGLTGRWREMTGRLREKDLVFGGGSPKTATSFVISSPRGVSSRAWDKELRYFREELDWFKETEQPGGCELDTLKFVARSVPNCAWTCGYLGKEDNWKLGSDTTRRKTMDRGGVKH